MTQLPLASRTADTRRSPADLLRGLLDLFSSVWLGIFWAALLFVYCSVGSAVPAVRQLPGLEMTEFEWFHWWPFNVLVLLFCVTLTVVTVRRIALRTVNLGVWMIHTGVIILCIGSYYYFGTKVEGDAPVFRRRVRIELPGMSDGVSLPALPGSETTVTNGADRWRFRIQNTNSHWPILSDEHKGEIAYAVNVLVTPPGGDPFIRQLLAGYPQYTEDILPGQGRAVKVIGRRLIHEDLKLYLDYEPQEYFHVMQTWALFVRRAGEMEWHERPIRGMPRYHDRIGSREQVFTEPGHPIPVRSMDLRVPPPPEGDALASADVRIAGYLRYAHLRRQWRDGGEKLNPVLQVSLPADGATGRSYELAAFDRTSHRAEDGMIQFVWLERSSLVDTLPTDSRAMLHIEVPETGVTLDVPITAEALVGSTGAYTEIKGTDFSYRIQNVQDNLVLPGRGNTFSVAIVGIKAPDTEFTRWVGDRPELTRDMPARGGDAHGGGRDQLKEVDPRISMTYRPWSAPILFAAHPNGLFLVVNGPDGRVLGREVEVGERVEVVPGLTVRADALWTRAVSQIRPFVVPPASRRRNVGNVFSMIRLEVDTGREIQSKWLRFNQYVFPSRQYAYEGRFTYTPEHFRLSDGSTVEVIFSRQRLRLPNPIALEEFALDAHLGGYTGQTSTIRNYVSKLRFLDNGEWMASASIRVNAPTEYGGYWYFQSTWDKPPSGNPTGGMNYTGLGVGNRNGVYIQLAGCCISVAGMLFAFYVKPMLKRRRLEQLRAETARPQGVDVDQPPSVSVSQTVEV